MNSFDIEYLHMEPFPMPKKIFLIAEIGINHNGDMGIAKQLIDMAFKAGCDAVKFQKRTIEIVYPKEQLDSPRESPWGKTTRVQKEGLEFGRAEYDEIDTYCRKIGIQWFASAWDIPSQEFLKPYNLHFNKIASAMVTNRDFVRFVAQEKKTTFISTGMTSYRDIDEVVRIFQEKACPYILLHTVSEYPAEDHILNLQVMHEMRKRYKCPVGYSGHETSVSPSLIAATLGAVAIERHITLDRAMYGSDQAASLEKAGLELLVGQIRKIPLVIGDGEKRISEKEAKIAEKLRYWRPNLE